MRTGRTIALIALTCVSATCARADERGGTQETAAANPFRFDVTGEYRLKIESLDAPDFDLRPTDQSYTAIGHRGLVSGDLHAGSSFRAFVQLAAAADSGRKPAERSFDRTRLDVAQAFFDITLPHATTLRVGRQVLDSGGNRLISTREAANMRLAFDMVHGETKLGDTSVTAFYGRPVLNQRGVFDDRHNPAEKFMGGWLTRPFGSGSVKDASGEPTRKSAPTVSVFFLSRDRARAVYQEGVASDHRRTIGARISATNPRWDYAAQAARQYGSFGADAIRAYGFAGDIGWHPQVRLAPRIGMSFGYASADRHRDNHLDTFDVIYPNLGYFTDAPVYFPGNTADVQPNVSVNVSPSFRVRAGSDIVMRISKNDAVYGPPGVPLISGTGAGPSFVAALSYARVEWTADTHLSVTLSYVHGSTGSLIRNAGGKDFNYGALVAGYRF